jgi:glycosyltransferase involved in cell wall biosynthesis
LIPLEPGLLQLEPLRSIARRLRERVRPKVRLPRPERRGDRGEGLRIGLWHEYVKPPYGGGNQFMMALRDEFLAQGADIVDNRLRPGVDVQLCNSTWFDVSRFERFSAQNRLRMVHRIDGPIVLYRGTDRKLDDEVFAVNHRFATATVLQSQWSAETLERLGYHARRPTLIHNAVNGSIFHPRGRAPFSTDRRIRLISTSWSDNPRKGAETYRWLDEHIDPQRFEYTFLGRTQSTFRRIQHRPAVPSEQLADALRQHDIYIAPSRNEPCSNALIEALACGLPVIYRNEGGHPELVKGGGLGFDRDDEIPGLLDKLVSRYGQFQDKIDVEPMESVAGKYLDVLRDAAGP